MKIFGISLSEPKPFETDEPIYSRFAHNNAPRMTRQTKAHHRVRSEPTTKTPAPRVQPVADPLYCEDNLHTSILRDALPQRFETLRQDVMTQARQAANELSQPIH